MDVYEQLDNLRSLIHGLTDRVSELEKRKAKPRGATKNWQPDELGQKILDLLTAVAGTGIKLNAGSLAGSTGSQIGKVNARLDTLKRRKLVSSHKGDTGYEMYWVEKVHEEKPVAPALVLNPSPAIATAKAFQSRPDTTGLISQRSAGVISSK